MLRKRIEHCHHWIDSFLQTEEAGSLHQHASLDKVIAAVERAATPADIEAATVEEAEDEMDEEVAAS